MSLLSRLNAKFGRYGIANVTVIFIMGQVLVYVASKVSPNQQVADIWERIQMYPEKVLEGEVWRLVTFMFAPPITNVIFAFFFWYLFYLMGTTLEVTWGAFRYNMFLLVGYLATIAFAFGAYFTRDLVNMPVVAPANNGFLYGTIFLAFARLYPDFTLYIFFVLPIKIRWLALLQWIMYGLTFLFGGWMEKAMVVSSVANYLLFFGSDIWMSMKLGHRRMRHQAQALKAPAKIVHKCRVCGLTSEQAPRMQFRYCSKCEGDNCYCADHLPDHEHVRSQIAGVATDDRS